MKTDQNVQLAVRASASVALAMDASDAINIFRAFWTASVDHQTRLTFNPHCVYHSYTRRARLSPFILASDALGSEETTQQTLTSASVALRFQRLSPFEGPK
jgi:hypothetical protein